MSFQFRSKIQYSIHYYCTTCTTDIHLLIQVQQVGVETDEKPLIPYNIVIIMSTGGEIHNQSYLNQSLIQDVYPVFMLICHPVLLECAGWRKSIHDGSSLISFIPLTSFDAVKTVLSGNLSSVKIKPESFPFCEPVE